MDPQATWNHLQQAFKEHDWDEVEELAQALLAWLRKGGFPPNLGAEWDPEFARIIIPVVVERAQNFAKEEKRKGRKR